MPDEPVGQDVGAQAQVLGADILAKLDELTQKPVPPSPSPIEPTATGGAGADISLEERKRLAKLAIDKMDAIVADYLAQVKSQQAAGAQEEIERIKASIGA